MFRFSRYGAAACLLFLCLGSEAAAHTARMEPIHGAVGFQAFYDEDEPIVDAVVEVYEGDEKVPLLTGISDAAGRFFFIPGTAATYRIVFDDGLGHMSEREFELDGFDGLPAGPAPNDSKDVIIGICILFGLFGLFSLWKDRSPSKGDR